MTIIFVLFLFSLFAVLFTKTIVGIFQHSNLAVSVFLGKSLLYGVFVLSLLVSGWLSTLSGVIVGGYLVYRTKRDPYDPFIRTGLEKGQSFHLDDREADMTEKVMQGLGVPATGVPGGKMKDKSGPSLAAGNAFLDQISTQLSKEAAAEALATKQRETD